MSEELLELPVYPMSPRTLVPVGCKNICGAENAKVYRQLHVVDTDHAQQVMVYIGPSNIILNLRLYFDTMHPNGIFYFDNNKLVTKRAIGTTYAELLHGTDCSTDTLMQYMQAAIALANLYKECHQSNIVLGTYQLHDLYYYNGSTYGPTALCMGAYETANATAATKNTDIQHLTGILDKLFSHFKLDQHSYLQDLMRFIDNLKSNHLLSSFSAEYIAEQLRILDAVMLANIQATNTMRLMDTVGKDTLDQANQPPCYYAKFHMYQITPTQQHWNDGAQYKK